MFEIGYDLQNWFYNLLIKIQYVRIVSIHHIAILNNSQLTFMILVKKNSFLIANNV